MTERPKVRTSHVVVEAKVARAVGETQELSRPHVWIWVGWAVAVAASFAVLEWLGLRRKDDRPMPLTQVIQRYVPRWLIAVVLGGFAFWGMEHFLL